MDNATTPKSRRERGSRQIYKDGVDRVTGKPRYFARFTVGGKRHHPKLDATDMEAAREELVARMKAAREGRPFREAPAQATAKLTVRQLAELYRGEAQPDVWNLDAHRRAFWSDFTRNVDPYIGNRAAVDVKRTEVAAWREKMKTDGKSARTILRGLGAASTMYNWALETGRLPDEARNPTEGVSRPSYKPQRELYTTEEVTRLLTVAATKAPDLHRLMAFAYFTGCRVGEIAALRWGDVDFHAHSVNVHRSFTRDARKNGKPVVVGLHPHLRDILGPLAGDDQALVFADPRDGKMRRKYDSKGGCWGIREIADMAKVRALKQPWHSFRASHATALEEAGATPSDIMRALGQSSIGVAMRYAQASPRRAAERVASLAPIGPSKAGKVITFPSAVTRAG